MEIWLMCEGEELRLPFVEISQGVGLSDSVNDKTANLYEIGDILIVGNDGLREFSYSSHFPDQAYGYLDVSDPLDPYDYVEIVSRFMNSKEPIRLIVTSTPVNLLMRIQSFYYHEKEGTGSVYYDLEMTEYKLIDEPRGAKAGEYDKAERRPRTSQDDELAEGFADRSEDEVLVSQLFVPHEGDE